MSKSGKLDQLKKQKQPYHVHSTNIFSDLLYMTAKLNSTYDFLVSLQTASVKREYVLRMNIFHLLAWLPKKFKI